jgi:hypothetical protein
MEAVCSPEMVVNFQQTAKCYMPYDTAPRNHRCENLISYCPVNGKFLRLTQGHNLTRGSCATHIDLFPNADFQLNKPKNSCSCA